MGLECGWLLLVLAGSKLEKLERGFGVGRFRVVLRWLWRRKQNRGEGTILSLFI